MSKCGATVYCWGIDPLHYQSGTYHFFNTELWGGNLGHAAVLLTIPNTPENLQLVEDKLGSEYIPDTEPEHIPWLQKSYITPSINLNQENAKPDYDNPVFKEDVIEIYFSWCNDTDEKCFQTFEKDLSDARCGVAFDYAEKWKTYLQPEERSQANGALSFLSNKKSVILGSAQVLHTASTTPEEETYLLAYHQQDAIVNDLNAIEVLEEKLLNRNNQNINTPLSGTEKRLIGKYLPAIDLSLPIDFTELNTKVATKKSDAIKERDRMYFEVLHAAITMINAKSPEQTPIPPQLLKLMSHLVDIKQLKSSFGDIQKLSTADIERIRQLSLKYSHSNLSNRFCILECYKPHFFETPEGYQNLLQGIAEDIELLHYKILSSIKKHNINTIIEQHTCPLIERTVSTGLYPATITLALRKEDNEHNTVKPGLDYKAMIERMAELAKVGNSFNIVENNCSYTSCEVIMAGAKDADRREAIFQQAELADIVRSPSTLFSNALEYERSLKDPNYTPPVTSYYQQLAQYVGQTASDHVAKSYDDELSTNQRRLHFGFGLMALSAYTAMAIPRYVLHLGAQQFDEKPLNFRF